MTSLLDVDEVDEFPAVAVRRFGRVFAEFGRPSQDSGNVSYGIEAGGRRFFVKTAGDPHDTVTYLPLAARITLLRNAIEVNRSVSHPTMPALLHVIESTAGPMLVFAWRDGDLVGGSGRAEPGSTFRRFLALPLDELLDDVLDAIFDLYVTLESAGWVVEDFYDGNVLYDFAGRVVTVADLDNSHRGPFVNEVGRMFGSSRFMAPEEFRKGAPIDWRTNVFTLGRTAIVFLAGDPAASTSTFRGSPQLLEVARRACEPVPSDRFGSVAEFRDAWRRATTPNRG